MAASEYLRAREKRRAKEGTCVRLRWKFRKIGMVGFRNALKVARRCAASHAGAREGCWHARALRVPEAHHFDSSSPTAVLVRVVTPTTMHGLQELEAGLPSGVPASARREDRGEKASAQNISVLAKADGGSAWGAGEGAAATLASDARGGDGRVCYGAQCAAGRGSPGCELSLLAPSSVTRKLPCERVMCQWAQPEPTGQVGLRHVRCQGFIGASGSSLSGGGGGHEVCTRPDLWKQPFLELKLL